MVSAAAGAFRAAVMGAPGAPMRVEALARPELEPNSAILETLFSEVCGTDVHLFHGRLAGVPYPIIPGHVSVGRIEALRGSMRDVEGREFREGDVVTFLDVHGTCGACHYCLVAKQSTRCPRRKVYGITFGLAEGALGGWSERIYLKPGTKLIRMPESVSPETYIAGGCGLNTAFHAVERAGVRLGDRVLVLGTGPVGQSIIAFAALAGADRVIAIGAPADRLEMARRMGATETISIEDDPFEARLERVRALTGGRGADVVLEAAGDPRAVAEGAAMARDGGVLAVAGQYTDNGPVSINVHELINKKHLEVRGVWGSDFSHFYKSLRAMERWQDRVPWRALITERFGLEETNEALAAVESRAVLKAAIVPGVARFFRADFVARFLERFTRWAAAQPDIRAVALVGSRARGEAGAHSDVDLVVLTTDRARYERGEEWTRALGARAILRTQQWGAVVERRLSIAEGAPEIDLAVGDPSWARTDPLDPGTARVVKDGMRILHDPDGLLGALAAAVAARLGAGA